MTHVFTEGGRRCPVTVVEPLLSEQIKSTPDLFKVGDFVDVTGVSKGKGFQGGMKRWNWSGAPMSHGSMSHRRAGSIGASATPSRVVRGKHMPGHMGNHKTTVQNLQVVKLDKENNILAIKGAIPGHKNSKVIIRKAKKRVSPEPTKQAVKEEKQQQAKSKK